MGSARALSARIALAVGLCLIAALAVGAQRAAANVITAENALPGTTTWKTGTASKAGLDGYVSEISVAPGGQLHLHVTAPTAVRYRIEVYRLGWYQGIGARLITCVPSCTTDEVAATTPPTPAPDPKTGYLDAGWPVTDTVPAGSNWVSGEYLAKLVLTAGSPAGQVRYIPFVVREATPTSQILVQVGVNTWEAYNNWGGKSLYNFQSTGNQQAYAVSFNRPYNANWNVGPFQFEYDAIRFLERNGYDVSYATDVDMAQGLDAPSSRRLVIDIGHDEYWSKEIRDALDGAQAAGTNFAFFGGDTGVWQVRYADGYRTLISYRSTTLDPSPNPATKTVEFRSLTPPRPECTLEGEYETNGLQASPPTRLDYSVASGALTNAWFTGTGLTQSSTIPGVVGYEWDTANRPGCPRSQVLFTFTGKNTYGQTSEADAATFTAPSGARVFAGGSLQFSWGLDSYGNAGYANTGLQTFTQNMLGDFTATPVPAAPPVSTYAPTVIGSPQAGQPLTGANGAWNGSPAPAFSYQWMRCDVTGVNCAAIPGATASTYTLLSADVGSTLELAVTATNGIGSATVSSAPTAVVTVAASAPANTSLPTVGGSVVQGQTLTAASGSWSGSPAPSFGYQWLRCDAGGANCAPVAGATAITYSLQSGDVGATVEVAVTGTNTVGSSTASSLPTGVVTVAASAPANTALPTVSGAIVQGGQLTATAGTWTGAPAPSFGYQWLDCDSTGANCAPVASATSQTYTLQAADVGATVEVAVTGSNSSGSVSASSLPTGVVTAVASAPVNTSLPTVGGSAVQGQTLSAASGAWSGSPAPSFSYQWSRCAVGGGSCVVISGATASSYMAVAADVGFTLEVVVTGTNPAGSASATSAVTAAVTSAPGPVTPLLDNFNRANNTGPPSASWSQMPQFSAGASSNLFISGQQVAAPTGNAAAYWNASKFGPDSEVWVTVAAKPAGDLEPVVLGLREQNANTTSVTGYLGYFINRSAGTDQYKITVRTNGAETATLASVTGPELNAGDQLLFRAIGSTLELWRGSAGTWTRLLAGTDSSLKAAGNISLWTRNTAVRLDNFGGGTLP
jgi:hypothetical protein